MRSLPVCDVRRCLATPALLSTLCLGLGCSDPGLAAIEPALDGGSDSNAQDSATTVVFSTDDPTAAVRLEVLEDTSTTLRTRLVAQGLGGIHSVALRLGVDPSVLSYDSIEASDAFQSDGSKSIVLATAKTPEELWVGAALQGRKTVDSASAVEVARIAFKKVSVAQSKVAVLPDHRLVLDDLAQPVKGVTWSGITGKTSQVLATQRRAELVPLPDYPPVDLSSSLQSLSRRLEAQRRKPPIPTNRSLGLTADVTHMQVSVRVDPVSKSATSATTIQVRSGVDSLEELGFLVSSVWKSLSPQATVDGKPVSSVTVTPYPQYAVSLVQFALPQALALGQEAEVRLEFSSEVVCDDPLELSSSSFCRVSEDSIYFLDPSFYATPYNTPAPNVVDDWDTDLEVRIPKGLVVAAAGVAEAPVDNGDGTETHRYSGAHNPIVAFAATKAYRRLTGVTSDQKPIAGFFLQTTDDEGSWHIGMASQILDFHTARYAPFPFKSMTLVEIPPEVPVGGIGWPSATYLSAPRIAGQKGSPLAAHLLAHELGHQWMGNLLPVDYGSAFWLQEGITEYAAYDFVRAWSLKETGTDAGLGVRRYYQWYYMFGMDPAKDLPLHPSSLDTSDALAAYLLSYVKGGSVVRSLADQVGEEGYLTATKELIAEHGFKDVVDWPTYRAAMEAASGASLQVFEDEWLGQSGYPTYVIGYQANRRGDGKVDATIEVSSEDDYHIPFTVAFLGPEGEEKRVKIKAERGKQQATFELDFCPEKYELDPEVAYLHLSRAELGGDTYRDGVVDGVDLAYLAFRLEAKAVSEEARARYSATADFDSNGTVDEADLKALKANFGVAKSCK